jgi:hypothetical protein
MTIAAVISMAAATVRTNVENEGQGARTALQVILGFSTLPVGAIGDSRPPGT